MTPQEAIAFVDSVPDDYNPMLTVEQARRWVVAAKTLREALAPEAIDLVPPQGRVHWDWCARTNSRGMSAKCNCGGPQARKAAGLE